jgi:hypothetical protein
MTDTNVSRRRIMGMGLAAASASVMSISGTQASGAAQFEGLSGDKANFQQEERFGTSFRRAYAFLQAMMDAYAQGATLRLVQSYPDQQGLMSTAFTYDNSLTIFAYLARGKKEDIERARIVGDSLLYAQQHDPNYSDGRLRQAYFVDQPDANGAYIRLATDPFWFVGSAVGDMAWPAMALAQLYRQTRDRRYLEGAVGLGNWIHTVTYDTRGAGGYNYGVDGANNLLTYKSTEHNIDVYALFRMLANLTGDRTWLSRAQHARGFLAAMWNASEGFFWTGTTPDGATINQDNIPADTQIWSFMALLDDGYAGSIDWAMANLSTIDTPQTINSWLTGTVRIDGASYASLSMRALAPSSQWDMPPNPNAVWLEGSAHLAAALLSRGLSHAREEGDLGSARGLLDNIRSAQQHLGKGQTVGGKALIEGQGIVSSSSVLNTGFGFSFNPRLHTGATAWYLIAGHATNPFQLGLR